MLSLLISCNAIVWVRYYITILALIQTQTRSYGSMFLVNDQTFIVDHTVTEASKLYHHNTQNIKRK